MKRSISFLLTCAICASVHMTEAQSVSISTNGNPPDNSAMLDVESDSKGMLIPRLTTAQREGIAAPATGLLVYDTETMSFWYFQSPEWVELTDNFHGLRDADHDTQVQVEENPDEDIIRFDIGGEEGMVLRKSTQGATRLDIGPNPSLIIGRNAGETSVAGWNTMIGFEAGQNNTTGFNNIFMGLRAGRNNQPERHWNIMIGNLAGANNDGSYNTMIGHTAGTNNLTGQYNTFLGHESGVLNTTGPRNTFLGSRSGYNNQTGYENTYIGFESGFATTSGQTNTAIGLHALKANQTGNRNVAVGDSTLLQNTVSNNVAVGTKAGMLNTTGSGNTFVGNRAGTKNTTGAHNSILGSNAGSFNTTGGHNVFVGSESGYSNNKGEYNTIIGKSAGFRNTTGNENIFIGKSSADYNQEGNKNIAIGTKALSYNNRGSSNIAIGELSLGDQIGEPGIIYRNIGIGVQAGRNTTGNDNIILGNESGIGMDGNNNLLLGHHIDPFGDKNTYLGSYTSADFLSQPVEATAIGYGTRITQDYSVIVGNATNENTKVGIGTINPTAWLHIEGQGLNGLRVTQNGANALRVLHNGKVIADQELLVNTDTGKPGYKLSVDGNIACEEVLVQNANDWPDYVFAEAYSLMSLEEVKSFIKTHSHLPGIPSAAEVKDGINVGDMQKNLLKKIEELTLYIIELESRITELEQK